MPSPCGIFAAMILADFAGFGPATLQLQEEWWENRIWPTTDVPRQVATTTLAIRSDGSRSLHVRWETFHHYGVRVDDQDTWGVFDASRKLAFFGRGGPALPLTCPIPPAWSAESTAAGFGGGVIPRNRSEAAQIIRSSILKNAWGIPVWSWSRTLRWIRFGEPDPALFTIPPRWDQVRAP